MVWITEKEEQILQMLQISEDCPPWRLKPRWKTTRQLSAALRSLNSSPGYVGVIGWERSGVGATLRRLLSKDWVMREPLTRSHRDDPRWLYSITPVGHDALVAYYEREDE